MSEVLEKGRVSSSPLSFQPSVIWRNMKFDYVPEMLPDQSSKVNQNIDYSLVRKDAQAFNQPKSSNLNGRTKVRSIQEVTKLVTEKVRSDTLSEKFSPQDIKVPVKPRQDYFIQALEETKQRLSLYQSICNGLA